MPKTTKNKTKKSARPTAKSQSSTTSVVKKSRKISLPKLRKRTERPPKPTRKLTGSFRLFADSLSLLRQHWKLFGGITIIYLLLSFLLVGGLGAGYDIAELKDSFIDDLGEISTSVALFGLLLGSSGSAVSESGAVYQTIVIILVSLAVIWSLRQVLAGEKTSVRDAFYKGMYPLVPFVLVLLITGLLLIPAAVGSFLYSVVFGGSLAVTFLEQVLWSLLIFGLMVWSLYLLSSRIFALYIVTLPDMRPIAAFKASRKISIYRRWSIIRKILFLPLAFVIIGAAVLLPLIVWLPAVVVWVFVPLSMFALVFAHTYIYSLYKELF